jgi:hypothetical protein
MSEREHAFSPRKIGPVFRLDGRIEQAIAADDLVVPGRLELQKGCLCYQYFPGGLSDIHHLNRSHSGSERTVQGRTDLPTTVTPAPRLVDHFIRLADAPEEEILGFARRWGVLDLCSHGLPLVQPLLDQEGWWDHGEPPPCAPLKWKPQGLAPELSGILIGRERLAHWRQWARRARALMRIAAALEANRPVNAEDWLEIQLEGTTPQEVEADLEHIAREDPLQSDARSDLYGAVNRWVEIGRVGPALIAHPGHPPVVRFTSAPLKNLFGMIGLQIMMRVSRVGSMAICSNCGRLYKPDRLPTRARQNFCQDCGRPVAVRMAGRRRMERMRQALELHGSGMALAEIARTVGSRPSTVRNWIKRKSGEPS